MQELIEELNEELNEELDLLITANTKAVIANKDRLENIGCIIRSIKENGGTLIEAPIWMVDIMNRSPREINNLKTIKPQFRISREIYSTENKKGKENVK